MSHEHGFINFEMSVLADGKLIPNLIFHIIQKDYKCLKTVKCSNFISKHTFITRKGNYSWLSLRCGDCRSWNQNHGWESTLKSRHTTLGNPPPTSLRAVWPFSTQHPTMPKIERPVSLTIYPHFPFLPPNSGIAPDHPLNTNCSNYSA